ncbi:MAG: alpha/beta fold hydrolase [Atopobiaceae bacterium]|jgi:pimeloyl-ACP methyl ester carboxylesterase/ribosomal protein S18 acetylase RimI-like enzyme|nr:alpha/beta fold hydrolase [Atopobiaceae bacterium]MCI2172802.1 alpha/beta fold hydrolase [Atopobiaceae bacterium]MCI2207109.1 alpha/beta fold hydrolase [Atopobiaceae bacterium]
MTSAESEDPIRETCVVVRMPDGADIHVYVHAPSSVPDAPGTPFGVRRDVTPLVCLHGNCEDHLTFRAVVDSLARERAVITIDSRGQGTSSRGIDPLSYELMAADALEVMSRLGVWEAHLLGFSDGGIEALLMARRAPRRIASLTVMGANLTPRGLTDDARDAIEDSWERAERLSRSRLAGDMSTMAELLRLMLDEPHIGTWSLEGVDCPSCVMAGNHDLVRAEETERIADALPHSCLRIVSDAGHDLLADAPDDVIRELSATISRAEAGGRGPLSAADVPEDVVILPLSNDPAWLVPVNALYDHVLDVCADAGDPTGWKRGNWPIPCDILTRLAEGGFLGAFEASAGVGAQASGTAGPELASRLVGLVATDGDLGISGDVVGAGPDWSEEDDVLVPHLLAVDPRARGRRVSVALLAAVIRRAEGSGRQAVRLNTSPENVPANELYQRMGLLLHKPVYLPYEGLDITPWSNLWELRLPRR